MIQSGLCIAGNFMNIKTTKEGWWVCAEDSHLSRWIEESGRLDHAPWLAEMACAHVPEGGVIIDAGAMLGDHTLTYSNKVGPDGTVLAHEPGEIAFECLKRNISRFDNLNVKVSNTALSNVTGDRVAFNENENLGASRCSSSPDGKVLTKIIDSINIGRLDLLKIDCEGYELKILQGAKETLLRLKPVILLEMNSEALKAQGGSYLAIYSFLEFMGYGWKICQPECTITDPQYDILAKPLDLTNKQI